MALNRGAFPSTMRAVLLLLAGLVLTVLSPHVQAVPFTATIAIDQAQLANISISTLQFSIRWKMVDQTEPVLITLFFHSFDNSGQILDEGLISNRRFGYSFFLTDPSGKANITLQSTSISTEGKLVFQVSTEAGVPSVTLSRFTGVTGPDIGLPGTSQFKAVITARSEVVDVNLQDNWIASFSWDNVKVGNETLPQLSAYDTTGAQIDGRLVTGLNVHLMPVRGSSGFWITAREVLANGISWFLESDFSIIVKPNQGFQVKRLPFISEFQKLRADLDGAVPEAKVGWLLPLGANQYKLFVGGFEIPNPDLGTVLDVSYLPTGIAVSKDEATGVWTARFKAARLGLTIPLTITTVAADGKYESTTHVEFRPHAFFDPQSSFNYIHASITTLTGSFGLFFGVFIWRRRRPRRFSPRELESLL